MTERDVLELIHDIIEYRKLKDSVYTLYDDINKKKLDNMLDKESLDDFEKAILDSKEQVDEIKNYYEDIQKQLGIGLDEEINDKKVNEVIKNFKIKSLERNRKEILSYYKKPHLNSLFIEITLRCNAKCEHCGSSCGYEFPKDEISAEHIKKTLLEISKKYDPKDIFISVTGGEPLMRKDTFDIMKYADELGFGWGLVTNGMLINDDIIKKMEETHMGSISISLDGLKETHENFRKVPGCYNIIIDNIKKVRKLKTLKCLEVTTVANKRNLHEIDDIYKLMIELGVDMWRLVTIEPIGRANESENILLNGEEIKSILDYIIEKKKERKIEVEYGCSHYLGLKYEKAVRGFPFKCMAGINVGSILANGDICVCPNVRRKELVQGNIKTDSFVDVWENKFKEFRKERITTNSKCKKCKSFKYCRGDSFHSWNFDEKKPNLCMKELLGDDFIEH